jgi:hypothetical protein
VRLRTHGGLFDGLALVSVRAVAVARASRCFPLTVVGTACTTWSHLKEKVGLYSRLYSAVYVTLAERGHVNCYIFTPLPPASSHVN